MGLDGFTTFITIINFTILGAIIMGIYKAIQGHKNTINRNKEIAKKMDDILNKLEEK